MSNTESAVAASLAMWHQMVRARDLSPLPTLLHPDATFWSPMALMPYHSAQAVTLIINTVFGLFEDFVYEREFATGDGQSLALEFSARLGDKQVKGVDLIRFDKEGRIIDFEVMIRPLNALQALGEEMGKRLGHLLPAYKAAKQA